MPSLWPPVPEHPGDRELHLRWGQEGGLRPPYLLQKPWRKKNRICSYSDSAPCFRMGGLRKNGHFLNTSRLTENSLHLFTFLDFLRKPALEGHCSWVELKTHTAASDWQTFKSYHDPFTVQIQTGLWPCSEQSIQSSNDRHIHIILHDPDPMQGDCALCLH